MIICPVCEYPQAQGDECDNCGKKLVAARPAAEQPVSRMPDLEMTPLVARGIQVPAERMPDLEATRMRGVPDVPAQPMMELERTRAEPTGPVPVQGVPDVDSGRAQDDGQRTVMPAGQLVCRYCRNVQASGLLCDRCGMRLPRVGPPAGTASRARAPSAADGSMILCPQCGSRARIGQPCSNCGIDVVAPTE